MRRTRQPRRFVQFQARRALARVSRPRRNGRPKVSPRRSSRETFGRRSAGSGDPRTQRECGVRRPAHNEPRSAGSGDPRTASRQAVEVVERVWQSSGYGGIAKIVELLDTLDTMVQALFPGVGVMRHGRLFRNRPFAWIVCPPRSHPGEPIGWGRQTVWRTIAMAAVVAATSLPAAETTGTTPAREQSDLSCEAAVEAVAVGELVESFHATLRQYVAAALRQIGLTVESCQARFRAGNVAAAPQHDLATLPDTKANAEPDAACTPASGDPSPPVSQPAPAPIVDPHRRDAEGRTPLHVAALEGDLAAVERLLQAGADIEAKLPDNGVTPLMMAAFKGHREVVELLVRKGADIHYTTAQGTSPLHYAAFRGDLPIVDYLLDAGAQADSRKPGGTTPLVLAAQHGHAAVITRLVEAGADVNVKLVDRRITGLMLAAQNGHAPAVSTLLQSGADVRQKDSQGRAACDYARANDRTDVVRLLEQAVAEIEARPRPAGGRD